MANMENAERRSQVTVEHLDAARRVCHNAVAAYVTGRDKFQSLADKAARQEITIREAARDWLRFLKYLDEIREQLPSPATLQFIELGNAGHDTEVSVEFLPFSP